MKQCKRTKIQSKMKNLTLLFLITFSLNSFAQNTEYDKLVEDGLQLLIQQNVPAAILKYKAAYKLDSTKVEANYGLGVAYLYDCQNKGGNCFTSLSYLNTAIKIDKNYRNGYFNRAQCNTFIKDYKKALADYNLAIKQTPNDPNYYINRAIIYKNIGNKENACNDLHKAAKLNSTTAKQLLITDCPN
jgi:tetratricopeptide (TPR) repeat protein